ncbi:MAG: SMP-30/gluconolactonase/LRE family protein [Pseudomonadota bacterium]
MEPVYAGTLVDHLSFPEAPRWHAGHLWFSDFYQHKVFRTSLEGQLEVVADVPGQPSGLGWLPGGDLLVVSMLDHRVLRIALNGHTTTHADLSGLVNAPCNDMVVANDGTAWVGNFGFDRHKGEAQASTVLIRIGANGDVSIAANGVMFPNGCALSADQQSLYLAESFANRITHFPVSAQGGLGERRVVYQAEGFFPDGLCLHEALGLWAADPVSRHVLNLDTSGKVIRTLRLPDNRLPIACAIGGADNNTLFVASNTGLGPGMAQQRNGRIEMFSLAT